jgi:NDP-sugar pyrophosphorylase family protein
VSSTKVVILAGARGTRFSEEPHAIPKPMVLIGGRPIIWHPRKHYLSFGFNEYVVACGYKGHVLKEYFASYRTYQSDIEVDLSRGVSAALSGAREDWKVTLVERVTRPRPVPGSNGSLTSAGNAIWAGTWTCVRPRSICRSRPRHTTTPTPGAGSVCR